MTALLHCAGPVVTCDGRVRQRCIWCGVTIEDVDTAHIAAAVTPRLTFERPTVPTWEPGAWIAVDGTLTYVALGAADAAVTDIADVPGTTCMEIDPDVTA